MLLVPRAQQDHKDLEATQEHLEHLVILAHKVLLDLRGRLETLDRVDQQGLLELLETLEHKVTD